MWRTFFHSLLLAVAPLGTAAAQEQSAPTSPAQPSTEERDGEAIIVTGKRQIEVEAVRRMTADITRPARIDKPLARFHQPFCPRTIGIKAEYATFLTERIRENADAAGAPLASGKCQPNALLIFAKDARKTAESLRKEHPWLFASLLDHEMARIFSASAAAFAWQTTELRGVDGRPMVTAILELGCPPTCPGQKKEITINQQYQTGRLNQPIRVDMSGAVVVIDTAQLPGKSLDQIADYATMRLLAATDEVPAEDADTVPTILSLFTLPESAPASLTRFDVGYLRAIYSMRPNAKATSIGDAAIRAYLAEAGD